MTRAEPVQVAHRGPVRLGAVVAPPETDAGSLAGLAVSTIAHNDGPLPTSALLQLYARARIPGILPRRAVLAGYSRVDLEAGERRTVEVRVEYDAVACLGIRPCDLGALDLWLSAVSIHRPPRSTNRSSIAKADTSSTRVPNSIVPSASRSAAGEG